MGSLFNFLSNTANKYDYIRNKKIDRFDREIFFEVEVEVLIKDVGYRKSERNLLT